jgi:streptomycin 6-kinase
LRAEGLSPADVVTWVGPAWRVRPNLVVPVRRPDGAERVVKVAVGFPDDYRAERDALRHYAALPAVPGVRAVELCGWDDDLGLLELERVDGFELGEGWPDRQDDAELTANLARTMRALWAGPVIAGEWRDLATWMQALDQPAAGIDAGLLARARDLGAELREGAAPVVLHGDFHHENVLREPDGSLVVIDPKGILGARGFDVGALLWNPIDEVLEHPQVMPVRLSVLAAELNLDRAEVRAWGWVAAVLSAAWEVEGGSDPVYPLGVAELIEHS